MLGLGVSAVFVYVVLRSVDLAQLQHELQSVSHVPVVLAMCVGVVGNLVRAVRWSALLKHSPSAKLRFFFTSMMIGYLTNNVLPARAGELVRIYVLERKLGISMSTSAATVVLERLTDVLVLLMLVGLLSFFLPLPAVIRSGSLAATPIFLSIAVLLLLLALKGKSLVQPIAQADNSLSHILGRKVQGILERFLNGLSALRDGRQALVVVILTAVIWVTETASVALIMKALHLNLPWIASLFVVAVLSLSFVIPAAPGAVGTYEFFAVVALTPFAVESSQAVGLALMLHAVAYFTSTALGLVCLWAEGLSWRVLTMNRNQPWEEKV